MVVQGKEQNALSTSRLDKTDHTHYSTSTNFDDGESTIHPFFTSADVILSPRADIWLFLFLSSCASTASLSVASPAAWRSTTERVALAAMGTSTAVSLCVAVGFRYRPSRGSLTKPLVDENITLELAVAMGTLALWLLSAALVFQSSGYMAVAETEIWNTNLFFATWISASFASYLVADLLTVENASGVLPREYSMVMGNAISRAWVLLFIASVSLLAFSITLRSGESCSGLLIETNVCQMTIVGIIFGIVGMVLPGGYLLVRSLNRHSSLRGQNTPPMTNAPKSKRNLLSTLLSITSFISFSINAAFVTSPTPQLGMSEPCNVYFSSWICFAISLYLCIRHAEVYLVPGSTRDITSLVLASQSTKGSERRLKRGHSGRSGLTESPHSQYSDDEDDDDDRRNADEVLTSMVDSKSDDGPMLFLPVGHCSQTEPSDMDDDASYPSMTPTNNYLPSYGAQSSNGGQYQQQQQQGREPHKPRPISPAGGYRAQSVASARRSASNSRSPVEPPEYDNARIPNSRNQDPNFLSDPSILTMAAEDIDTKVQARISSGSSEGPSRSGSSGGKSRGRRRRKNTMSPEGQRGVNPQSFHVDEQLAMEENDAIANENHHSQTRSYLVESTSSEWGTSTDPSAVNPLDRTTRPPLPRSFHTQQKSVTTRDPSFHRQEPSFRETNRQSQQVPQMQTQYQPIDSVIESSDGTSVATTQGPKSKASTKSKSTKSSGSKSRSSSRKKRRSKSRDGEKKLSRNNTQEPSTRGPAARSMRSATGNTAISSRGPPTTSDSSGGPMGQGPPTMSCSSGGGGSIDGSSASAPLTDEGTPLTNEGMTMGHVGPGRMKVPPPPPVVRTPGNMYSTEGGDNDPQRPMNAIHGTYHDAMSMVSEPTMDGFGPPGNEYSNSRTHNPQSKRDFRGSSQAVAGGDTLRYSNTDLSSGNKSSSDTNKSNKALRQGAVDQMVMEALRQAQEARQGGSGAAAAPPADMGAVTSRRTSQATNGSKSLSAEGRKSPGGRQTSLRSGSISQRSPHGSKSPHGGKKQQISSRNKQKKGKMSSSSGRASGSGGKVPGSSIHSFYSGSEATSLDVEDAYAC